MFVFKNFRKEINFLNNLGFCYKEFKPLEKRKGRDALVNNNRKSDVRRTDDDSEEKIIEEDFSNIQRQ